MTKPVCKIETWNGSLNHTITDDALRVYFKEVVTDGIGHFMFTVPTKKNGNYKYDDIALHDKVKIWMGYDSVSGDPDFIGYVRDISAPLSIQGGYLRAISGLSQGEILLNRLKKNKYYDAVGASTIVTEWANDLNLGVDATKLVPDATAVTLEVKTKSYFDLLREISDYWVSAGSQLKKDFYVDVDNDLVWKDRPLRSAGVETLTVGKNIKSYQVTRSKKPIKNDIVVYGAAEKPLPSDKDSWTETLDNWSATYGTLSLDSGTKKIGNSIKCTSTQSSPYLCDFKLTLPQTVTIRNIKTLYFWHDIAGASSEIIKRVYLYAPTSADQFYLNLTSGFLWVFAEYGLGPNYEYDAEENPNGIWTWSGDKGNWWDIQEVRFYIECNQSFYTWIDVLYFYPERWEGSASDTGAGSSQEKYGQRDLEVTDDKLHSDAECDKRAETLLYQRKDPPVQIDVTVKGNNNILVGDRLSMTIPAENITAQNYDVFSVENFFQKEPLGYLTKASMVNSANIRKPVATSPLNVLADLRRVARQLSLDIKEI